MKTIATIVFGSLAIGSVSAIIGGEVVPTGQSSYTSYLSLKKDGVPICGAALINSRHVLTSASCTLQRPTYVTVGAQSYKNTTNAQKFEIVETRLHPKYDAQNLNYTYDLAVLKLGGESSFDSVKLPFTDDSSRTVKTGDVTTAFGWGGTNLERFYGLSEYLRSVELPVIENGACRKTTGFSFINRQYLCAGGRKDKALNYFDSGGPLVLKNDARVGGDMVVGVMTFAQAGPDFDISVYARVSAELDWIKSQL